MLACPVAEIGFDSADIQAMEADCIIVVDDPQSKVDEVVDMGRRLQTQSGAIWGLDRIDQRDSNLDNSYNYGSATGSSSRVYILDTGVRTDHTDFGGRAIGGWSAGCIEGTEAGCGSDWVYQGIITSASSSCSGHGTHCASTAAGTSSNWEAIMLRRNASLYDSCIRIRSLSGTPKRAYSMERRPSGRP